MRINQWRKILEDKLKLESYKTDSDKMGDRYFYANLRKTTINGMIKTETDEKPKFNLLGKSD